MTQQIRSSSRLGMPFIITAVLLMGGVNAAGKAKAKAKADSGSQALVVDKAETTTIGNANAPQNHRL